MRQPVSLAPVTFRGLRLGLDLALVILMRIDLLSLGLGTAVLAVLTSPHSDHVCDVSTHDTMADALDAYSAFSGACPPGRCNSGFVSLAYASLLLGSLS